MSIPIVLIDDEGIIDLQPLTLSRSCADIRWGIMTIKEKWEWMTGQPVGVSTMSHLQGLYLPLPEGECLYILSRLLPTPSLWEQIRQLQAGEDLTADGHWLAGFRSEGIQGVTQTIWNGSYDLLQHPWEIFQHNGREINRDFERITNGRTSQKLDESNRVLGHHPVFLEEGAQVFCSIINATEGPVYVGKHAEIQEGCMVRGPFSLGEYSQLKMGARIYTGTTIGPHCKIGGEVNNSVIFGYSNKAHEGFLGNAVIGSWCNLGADTNNSNLKNNYDLVKIWSYRSQRFISTGLQFCGLIMGDHSKTGINTMLNTGTVVGFSCNIFGSGFPRNFIPSFTWGGASGSTSYELNKALQTAERVYERRQLRLSEAEKSIFEYLFNQTK
jgi:UDP-N-acetylglucosamine diphosphorylase/glucosamine-1-phosphate N-acetyltransferase